MRVTTVEVPAAVPVRRSKRAKLRGEIQLGLDDIAAGRTVEGRKAFAALRKKLK